MNWKLVSDGLILISFKSIGVFPAVFSVAGLGLWESRSLSVPSVGFGPGPWWAVATWPAVPASTPGNSNICRTSLAVMQMLCKRDCSKHPTAPRWELAQRVTGGQAAGEELKPKDHLSLEPADKATYNKQPKLPSVHHLLRLRHWNHTDWTCLLTLCMYIHQCFCKPPKGS